MTNSLRANEFRAKPDVVAAVVRSAHNNSGQPLIRRAKAQPNAWTFTIKPIRHLVHRYVGSGKGWVDPFAGETSPAEWTNDLNPERKARYHMDALDFCKMLKGEYEGVIFDPPYSYRQVSEHYAENGRKATALDTSSNFYMRVMNAICDKVRLGGLAISCGWNTNGFGGKRGFRIVEILIVAHGSHHNDTLVTVEQKVRHQERLSL
jgi:hypothetical protein